MKNLILVGALSLTLWTAAVPTVAAELEPVPQPPLESAGADVQALIEDQRALVDELVSTSAADQELADAFGTLGRLYFAYQFVEAARASFRNALTLSPNDYRWVYYLGLIQLETREFEAAAEGFGRIVRHRYRNTERILREAAEKGKLAHQPPTCLLVVQHDRVSAIRVLAKSTEAAPE